MKTIARRAYGYARASVLKSGLRRAGRVAGQPVAVFPEPLPSVGDVLQELLRAYRVIFAGYPDLRTLVDTLLGRHELANLLLALRAVVRGLGVDTWRAAWRPLATLETLPSERAAECTRPTELAALLRTTRLAGLESLVAQCTPNTLGASTLAAERVIARSIMTAAALLPDDEGHLIELLIIEHDVEWLWRAPSTGALSPEAIAAATTLLHRQLTPDALRALAAWLAGASSGGALPARWTWAESAADAVALLVALRHERRRVCLRAFAGNPFSLAFPLAVLLLKEEELRAIAALNERGAHPASHARACAASLLGA